MAERDFGQPQTLLVGSGMLWSPRSFSYLPRSRTVICSGPIIGRRKRVATSGQRTFTKVDFPMANAYCYS